MRTSTLIKSGMVLIAFAALAVSCAGDDATSPDYQAQVQNMPNQSFGFQATGLERVDDVLYYTWSVASGKSVIYAATSTDSGSVTLRIRDAQGTTIYEGDVPASGDITPPPGASGDWKIRLTLQNYTGSINFALQMQ